MNTPARSSALFALLTLPGHANWEILTFDNQEEVHLEAGLHPFYRDQILCIFSSFSPTLQFKKKEGFIHIKERSFFFGDICVTLTELKNHE